MYNMYVRLSIATVTYYRVQISTTSPLPSNHVNRQILLDEIATKLLQATNDPNKYETTLTITGAGGFGKTTTVSH